MGMRPQTREDAAFGGSPGEWFAFSKHNDEVTLNMSEMRLQMTLNGDYRLVHAYQPTAPNPSVSHHQRLVRMFEVDPDLHRQYLAPSVLALAALFQQDRASLKSQENAFGQVHTTPKRQTKILEGRIIRS
jgi:hypothetical protein